MTAGSSRPLVLHVLYRFAVGGLENGVVNLINHMPEEAYRHAVLSLTDATDFRNRLRSDTEIVELNKAPGHLWAVYPRLHGLMRAMKPAIVHTRNLAALEAVVPAFTAGVGVRIHGEHGRDVSDLDGENTKYRWVRRAYRPFVSHYVTVSRDLASYLQTAIGVPSRRVSHICNGVDISRFRPSDRSAARRSTPFADPNLWLVGWAGRMEEVKDPLNLVRAFVKLIQGHPELKARVRLVMIGDGILRADVTRELDRAALTDLAWLSGTRNDVPELLPGLDCFVLPSKAEGISNTVLEAMSCGLPVIATRVGGNPELIDGGETGELVASQDDRALADAIARYALAPETAREAGRRARAAVLERFSLQGMVDRYRSLYDRSLGVHPRPLDAMTGGTLLSS